MVRRQKIAYEAELAARIRVRGVIGRLSHRLVQPRTLRKYSQMVAAFTSWVHSHGASVAVDFEHLDFEICEWIETLWATGRPAGDAGATISAMQFFTRRKRIFPSARGLLRAWQRTEAPQRAPPMPEFIVMSLACVARHWGRNDVAALLVLGYSAFLRTMELLSLRRWQLQFATDGFSLVIALPLTKGGLRRHAKEAVVLRDPRVISFLRVLKAHLAPDAVLQQGTVPEFRALFKQLVASLGVARLQMQPYSLRRGGATMHYRRFQNMGLALQMGRWADSSVARIYIAEGVEQLLANSFTEDEMARFASLASGLDFDVRG